MAILSSTVELEVVLCSGDRLAVVEVETSSTVKQVKAQLLKDLGKGKRVSQLLVDSKVLRDEFSISYAGLSNGTVVNAVLAKAVLPGTYKGCWLFGGLDTSTSITLHVAEEGVCTIAFTGSGYEKETTFPMHAEDDGRLSFNYPVSLQCPEYMPGVTSIACYAEICDDGDVLLKAVPIHFSRSWTHSDIELKRAGGGHPLAA